MKNLVLIFLVSLVLAFTTKREKEEVKITSQEVLQEDNTYNGPIFPELAHSTFALKDGYKPIKLSILVDKTFTGSRQDINEIVNKANEIYSTLKVQFTVSNYQENKNVLKGDLNFDNTLDKIRKGLNGDDILIVVTGNHMDDNLGKAFFKSFETDKAVAVVDLNAYTNKNKLGVLLSHEIGHIFGLDHSENHSIMASQIMNTTDKFSLKEKRIIKRTLKL